MNKFSYRNPARDRKTTRMKQVVTLFLAVVGGILVSVSVNF